MRKILNVYLARANTPYSEAYADLDLPASPYELLDALDKLRLDEGEAPYLQINEYYDFEELAPLLSGDAGLYELNALAQKLSELDERQQVSFKGLVQMEVNKKQGFIPMSRLIDLAYSTDCCHVTDALNDSQLGRFYAENGFVPEVEHLPDKVFELLDFERIGREARIGECGVFTKQGYVVQHTELNEAFQTMDLTLKQPDYQILMELTDGGFLGLPQTALPDTQPRRCLDCRIPLLSGALDSVKDIEILNGFAEKLSTMTGKEILRYGNAHPGLFVGNAYVCYPTEEPDFHYNGSNLESCVDNDWSVKLKLASQHTPNGVWLRLPDYEELNDGKPDEIRIALDALGVEHIDECTMLEAKCILPEIRDLTQQYDRISDLVYDGQNLGFVLDERGQGMRNFLELYAAALEYEDCSRLSAALDIAESLNRYNLIPVSGLREYAEKDLKSQGVSIPELAQSTFGFEEYAVELLEERGFSLSRNGSCYICKEQSQRFSEMSME